MIEPDETFDGTWPFLPHFTERPGFSMHYVDEGSGAPIVCLHGEPTWGYLYRRFIPALSRRHRVVVPDHMGFGKSETPQGREYTLRSHVENLEALLLELDLEEITFVLQDWGGAIGGLFALRHPERVARLFLMNTLVPLPAPGAEDVATRLLASRWFQWILRGQREGWLEEVLGNLGSTVLSVMKIIGFENLAAVDETWIRAYSAPFATRAECRGAVAFPLDVTTGKAAQFQLEQLHALGAGAVEAVKRKPAWLVNGLRDQAIPPRVAIEQFRAQFPGAPVVELPGAGHFCQEDAPETLVPLIEQFVQTT